MTTYSPRKADQQPGWHLVDASGQTLGRLATRAAELLRGKHNPRYATHLDMGDYVVVVNAEKIVVTGNKASQKVYTRYSGYPSGLKTITYARQLARFPERVIEHAIRGMLPKTALGRAQYKKLRVYRGPDHPHQGQLVAPVAEPAPVVARAPEPAPIVVPAVEPAPVVAETPAPIVTQAPEPAPTVAPTAEPAPIVAPTPEQGEKA